MDLGDAGPASSGGVRVDSILEEADGTTTAWTSLTSRSGEQVIGLATVDEDGHFVSAEGLSLVAATTPSSAAA